MHLDAIYCTLCECVQMVCSSQNPDNDYRSTDFGSKHLHTLLHLSIYYYQPSPPPSLAFILPNWRLGLKANSGQMSFLWVNPNGKCHHTDFFRIVMSRWVSSLKPRDLIDRIIIIIPIRGATDLINTLKWGNFIACRFGRWFTLKFFYARRCCCCLRRLRQRQRIWNLKSPVARGCPSRCEESLGICVRISLLTGVYEVHPSSTHRKSFVSNNVNKTLLHTSKERQMSPSFLGESSLVFMMRLLLLSPSSLQSRE